MKPLLVLFAIAGTALAQQPASESGGSQPSAADITRGRAGGDASRTSTSVRIEGDANQGAGVNNLAGESASKTPRIDPAATNGTAATAATPSVTVTGASSSQPDIITVQPVKTSGTTSPAAGATDSGAGAER